MLEHWRAIAEHSFKARIHLRAVQSSLDTASCVLALAWCAFSQGLGA